jgi:AraC-like DNA-binding protein
MGQKVPERGVSIDHPAVTVVEISDPTIANQGFELIDQDAVKLTSTPFRARRVVVRLEGGVVVYHSTNHRVRTRTKAQRGLLAYVVFGPRAKGTVNGLPIRPELMLAAEPEAEAAFVTDAGYESITLLLPPEDIRTHLSVRGREEDFRLPHGLETLQAKAGTVRWLFDLGKRLTGTAARQPALFNDRKDERAAAQVEMVEALLATLGVTVDFEPARADQTLQSQALIVKTAEEYAMSHVEDHVQVTDLCRAAAASERALEYAFKQVMGLTPVAYLIRLRLHRARQALLAATHGTTTVSAVALDWGFWHFGEFSRAYKDCFGELPSDTLRRRPASAERQGADLA